MFRAPALAFAAALLASATVAEAAPPKALLFMQRFGGEWIGTGQLLIGPQIGTQFHCALNGNPSSTQMTLGMSGKCWMGSLSVPVLARIHYDEPTDRFYGSFMDGAAGNGVDIMGAQTETGVSLRLTQGILQGGMLAEPVGDMQMRVLLSFRDRANDRDIPVVSMGFTRKEASSMGLPNFDLSQFENARSSRLATIE
ncbi:hypothetical protein [Propylenella binzhouense]|uniref:DUF1579 domain-containing protein n=1 Tax=Propylenella binzhouense TaxID=2555902 RepID=A0A964WVD0_9HYPH|nr:hypothetical protein [Propylenella binzhouense]MYZ49923.1 hypothetical protein [Propylenella binzhouense]